MIKKTNKKGFTLAELLIVVAIIAVLVAIAVPLFVGAIDNAEEKVQAANKRAVRGAAVEKILMTDDLLYKTEGKTRTKNTQWEAEALLDASGDIIAINVVVATGATTEECTKTKGEEKTITVSADKTSGTAKSVAGGYYIKIGIKELDATSYKAS